MTKAMLRLIFLHFQFSKLHDAIKDGESAHHRKYLNYVHFNFDQLVSKVSLTTSIQRSILRKHNGGYQVYFLMYL